MNNSVLMNTWPRGCCTQWRVQCEVFRYGNTWGSRWPSHKYIEHHLLFRLFPPLWRDDGQSTRRRNLLLVFLQLLLQLQDLTGFKHGNKQQVEVIDLMILIITMLIKTIRMIIITYNNNDDDDKDKKSSYLLLLFLTYDSVLANMAVQVDDVTLDLARKETTWIDWAKKNTSSTCWGLKGIILELVEKKKKTLDFDTDWSLDFLGPVGVLQCVESVIVHLGRRTDVGNHHRATVAAQGVFEYPCQLAVSVRYKGLLFLKANRKPHVGPPDETRPHIYVPFLHSTQFEVTHKIWKTSCGFW